MLTDSDSTKNDVPTSKKFAAFIALVCVLFSVANVPARLVVDGKTESWFTVCVPEPERFSDKIAWAKPAQLKRGWPWLFQDEAGYQFITKEERSLFLPKPGAPSMWRSISSSLVLADLAVSTVIVISLDALLRVVDYVWRSRRRPV